jgi:type VI secretion system protein VasJ
MKGPGKGLLACGLLRDSSDSLGRPYPLLVMGSGFLQGWEECWELLPLACERTWEQMESIAAGAFPDFEHLKKEVRGIQSPRPQWSEFRAGQTNLPVADGCGDCGGGENEIKTISEGGGDLILLEDRAGGSPRAAVQLWHSLWKRQFGEIPRVIFMGGNGDKLFVAFFLQPLTAEDFSRLWSA